MAENVGRLESTPVPRRAEHLHAPYVWAARAAPSEDLREIIYGRRDLRRDLKERLAWAMKCIYGRRDLKDEI